jgi:hypothetical protein
VTKAEIAERRRKALQLRLAGATLAQVGQQLGVSESRACRIVQDALDQTVREPADELRKLEVARLDQLWVEVTKILRRRHLLISGGTVVLHPENDEQPLEDDAPALHAVDRLVRIMERRARLLGLDAPTKVSILSDEDKAAIVEAMERAMRELGLNNAAAREVVGRHLRAVG